MNLSDPVMAALIGAGATFATALFQLTSNARRQAAERAAGKPITRRAGSWFTVAVLLLAALVGGYALAEYQGFQNRGDDKALRQEMQTRLRELSDVAARLERVALQKSDQPADAKPDVERRRGIEGVAAVIGLPACSGGPPGPGPGTACNEGTALRASVCAIIPAAAVVTEVQFFTRMEDSTQPWSEARVQLGQDAGAAKFVDAFSERVQAEGKEVCQRFIHWNSQKPRLARILVKYTP
jgi:hypothetical protein